MKELGHRRQWATAAGLSLALLVPVFYAPAHTCLRPDGLWLGSPAGRGHKGFCNGCVFQWLSWSVLPALAALVLLTPARFTPTLRTLPLVFRAAASPTSRAPPVLV